MTTLTVEQKAEKKHIEAGMPKTFWLSSVKGTFRHNGVVDANIPKSNRQQRRNAFKEIKHSYFTKKFANLESRNNAFQGLPEALKSLLIRAKRMTKLFSKSDKKVEKTDKFGWKKNKKEKAK